MQVGFYLTFDGDCSDAFDFYKSIFGGEFEWKMTCGETPMKGQVDAKDHSRIMHMALVIGDGNHKTKIMGCDYVSSIHKADGVVKGNNTQIQLAPTSLKEAERLYEALSNDGGKQEQPLKKMFWGSYFGCLTDKFGIRWMIDYYDHPTETSEIRAATKELVTAAEAIQEAVDKVHALTAEPVKKRAKVVTDGAGES